MLANELDAIGTLIGKQNILVPQLIHYLKRGSELMLIIAKGIGISLLVTNKSISQCLLDGTQQLKQNIGEYHAGFRTKRSCPGQTLNRKVILRHQ